jgi:hypothetical protein
MSNGCDYPWSSVKSIIAKDLDEITMLWMCGVKHRERAHSEGVYRWTDLNCTTDLLGFNPKTNTNNILQALLDINRAKDGPLMLPKKLKGDMWSVLKKKQSIEFFIDFETMHDVIENVETGGQYGRQIVFMIGVGYVDKHNRWIYKSFLASELTTAAEIKMCDEFAKYVKDVTAKYRVKNPLFVHWSHAEPCVLDGVLERAGIDYDCEFNMHLQKIADGWFDLLKLFKNPEQPIVIKGCMAFGLKEVAGTMHSHGMIKTKWDSSIHGALEAMLDGHRAYEESKDRLVPIENVTTMVDIIRYNEVDVIVLREIVDYLRENM